MGKILGKGERGRGWQAEVGASGVDRLPVALPGPQVGRAPLKNQPLLETTIRVTSSRGEGHVLVPLGSGGVTGEV